MKKTKEELLQKLNKVAKPADSWLAAAQYRIENHEWLQISQATALKILRTLRAQGKTQKQLAEALNVSPQQVNKWVKGKENFTFETVAKIGAALNVQLIAVPPEKKETRIVKRSTVIPMRVTSKGRTRNYSSGPKGKLVDFTGSDTAATGRKQVIG